MPISSARLPEGAGAVNMIERIRTHAESGLIEQFDSVRDGLPGKAAVTALRNNAFNAFNQTGLPHRRIEAWHYTDLRASLKETLPIGGTGDVSADLDKISTGVKGAKVALINGRLDPVTNATEGVSLKPLSDILAETSGDWTLLGTVAPDLKDPLIDLNTAFMSDGVFVDVAEAAEIEQPLELIHVTAGEDASSYVRHFVHVGRGAKVTLIENHVCTGEANYQSNCVVELKIEDGATVNWIKIQDEGARSTHVGSFKADIGAEAELNHFTFVEGGALTRTQLFVSFSGEQSKANLSGASLVNGTMHSDITLVMDHAVPNCESREFYKNVIDDTAHSVFQGNIIVKPDAQKTDGQMMVQSLLLSDDAAMSSKPELEIFADDVQCAHGATTGQIDEDLLFYLRSRGISEAEARTMLVLAFLSEAIEEIDNEDIVALLEDRTRAWLGA